MPAKDEAVVDAIEPRASSDEIAPGGIPLCKSVDQASILDASIFKESHEYKAIQCALHKFGQGVPVQTCVAILEEPSQSQAVFVELLQKRLIDGPGRSRWAAASAAGSLRLREFRESAIKGT